MIECYLHHLEARCRERGYTLDEVRPCIVSQDGGRLVVDETHPAFPARRKVVASGPGAELKKLLRMVGIAATPTCPCNARAAQMDAWGADECQQRLDEIVGWLREEAANRRLPFSEPVARQVVLLAIRRARKAGP
jgi:hypothetical protein